MSPVQLLHHHRHKTYPSRRCHRSRRPALPLGHCGPAPAIAAAAAAIATTATPQQLGQLPSFSLDQTFALHHHVPPRSSLAPTPLHRLRCQHKHRQPRIAGPVLAVTATLATVTMVAATPTSTPTSPTPSSTSSTSPTTPSSTGPPSPHDTHRGPNATAAATDTSADAASQHDTDPDPDAALISYDLCIGYACKAKRPSRTKKELLVPPLAEPPFAWSDKAAAAAAARAMETLRGRCRSLDCGEDAFFVTKNTSAACIGIADGVGGWSELGIDPSLFSWRLMEKTREAAEAAMDAAVPVDPQDILGKAYDAIQANAASPAGSSTACIVALDKQRGILRTCNLGDSGYGLWRNGELHRASTEQQHWFNAPYQLAYYPVHLGITPSPGSFLDLPKHACAEAMPVHHGDVLILATDGLYDNVHPHELQPIIARALRDLYAAEPALQPPQPDLPYLPAAPLERTDGRMAPPPARPNRARTEHALERAMHALSEHLTAHAQRLAADPKRQSPFSHSARRHGLRHDGGKIDDITVVAAYVLATEVPRPMALL